MRTDDQINNNIWLCPICQAALQRQCNSFICESRHSFDIAKEGYVNLLAPNKKRTVEPGDSSAMVAARRAIHSAALYRPLSDHLCALVSETKPNGAVLDIGCGEGYYDGQINTHLPSVRLSGIDIAKPAVRAAAKKYQSNSYAVASSNALPLNAQSIDLCFSIFAPTNTGEIRRVLRDEGHYIEVGPAPTHLYQLREALYPRAHEHKPLRTEIAGLQLVNSGELDYLGDLTAPLIRAIIEATPMAHRGEPSLKASLLSRAVMQLNFAFSWRLYQKVADEPAK